MTIKRKSGGSSAEHDLSPAGERMLTAALAVTVVGGISIVLVSFLGEHPRRHHHGLGVEAAVFAVIVPCSMAIALISAIVLLRSGSMFRAAIVVIGSFAFTIIVFANIYLGLGTTDNWNVRLSRLDALMVALGTLMTAGNLRYQS